MATKELEHRLTAAEKDIEFMKDQLMNLKHLPQAMAEIKTTIRVGIICGSGFLSIVMTVIGLYLKMSGKS